MIVTTYGADGTKVRKPVGYAGKQCNKATEPYEARELGSKKKPTDDMYREEPPVEQRQRSTGS